MAQRKRPIGGIDVTPRAWRVRQAVPSAELEGQAIPAWAMEVFQRYADHDISFEDVIAVFDAGEPGDVGEARLV
jgi:hypothetical protein